MPGGLLNTPPHKPVILLNVIFWKNKLDVIYLSKDYKLLHNPEVYICNPP